MRLSPAIAPLRRVIEQVVRLLDVMAPVLGQNDGEDAQPVSRQDRRQKARQAARASTGGDDDGAEALTALRNLFVALRDDLEHSGMIDVVVNPEDGPGVVLTLDKRFADQTALELLHTSNFTVVGKVTRVWPANDDVVFLYRRSVLSLLPALSQQVVVGVFAFLFGMAKAIGVVDFEKGINAVLGQSGIGSDGDESAKAEQEADGPEQDRPSGTGAATEARGPDADADTAESGAAEAGDSDDDFRVGDDIVALNPVLEGPAVQVLPLALCI